MFDHKKLKVIIHWQVILSNLCRSACISLYV